MANQKNVVRPTGMKQQTKKLKVKVGAKKLPSGVKRPKHIPNLQSTGSPIKNKPPFFAKGKRIFG